MNGNHILQGKLGMKESTKDRRPEGATRKPGLIDKREIRELYRNFTPGQLLAISETLTALARSKIKSAA